MEEFDPKEFESISPYSDAEAVEALGKVADHPAVPAISQYLFPKEDPTFLRTALKSIHSIDEFQQLIMSKAILWDIQTTAHNFSYDGINYLKEMDGKFLILSNHRDIILDPAQSPRHHPGPGYHPVCAEPERPAHDRNCRG